MSEQLFLSRVLRSWATRDRTSSSIIWRLAAGLRVDGGHALEGGKGLDGFSGFLLGDPQIVEALQIDPEFGTGAEEMRQAQRRIGRDVPASVQNLGDAIGWNLQLACQRGGAHVEFLQFLGQMFSGMDREQWHLRSFPTGNRLLVVIDNFNIRRTGGAL